MSGGCIRTSNQYSQSPQFRLKGVQYNVDAYICGARNVNHVVGRARFRSAAVQQINFVGDH